MTDERSWFDKYREATDEVEARFGAPNLDVENFRILTSPTVEALKRRYGAEAYEKYEMAMKSRMEK